MMSADVIIDHKQGVSEPVGLMNFTVSVSDKNIGFTLNYGCIYW